MKNIKELTDKIIERLNTIDGKITIGTAQVVTEFNPPCILFDITEKAKGNSDADGRYPLKMECQLQCIVSRSRKHWWVELENLSIVVMRMLDETDFVDLDTVSMPTDVFSSIGDFSSDAKEGYESRIISFSLIADLGEFAWQQEKHDIDTVLGAVVPNGETVPKESYKVISKKGESDGL